MRTNAARYVVKVESGRRNNTRVLDSGSLLGPSGRLRVATMSNIVKVEPPLDPGPPVAQSVVSRHRGPSLHPASHLPVPVELMSKLGPSAPSSAGGLALVL